MMPRPHTITDFRRVGQRLMGRSPANAKRIHDGRPEPAHRRPTLSQFIRSNRLGVQPARATTISLGLHDTPPVHYTQARNWRPVAAGYRSHEAQHGMGRYSSRCHYTRYEYQQEIESWGCVVAGHLYYRIATGAEVATGILRPWRGWHWAVDQHGICLVDGNGRRDYHPTASDLLATPGTRAMAALARANDCTRRAVAKRSRHERGVIRRAQTTGLRVCLRDSVEAGNCAAGTTTWARQHKLDPICHYTPSRLLALANGDQHRVALVVAVAARRHQREMAAGVCQLADHR